MTNDDELRKDVFAWYGGAAYAAQLFEQELIILLILTARLENRALPSNTIEDLDEWLSKKTLGGLLRELKKKFTLAPDFERLLNEYLEKRNFLAHRFFVDHATDLLSRSGCERLVEELKGLSSDLREADLIAQTMSRNVRAALGISEAALDAEVKRYMDRVRGGACEP